MKKVADSYAASFPLANLLVSHILLVPWLGDPDQGKRSQTCSEVRPADMGKLGLLHSHSTIERGL